MKSIFDPERVQKISEIMPKFGSNAAPNDRVKLGLMGDPCFPAEYENARPAGTITDVKHGKYGTTVKVRVDEGPERMVGRTLKLKENIDPAKLWEFTDETFKNRVLPRVTEGRRANFRSTAIVPKPREAPEMQSIRAELEAIKKQNEDFRSTVVDSISNIAKDVCAMNKDAPFCSVLNREYERLNTESASLSYRASNDDVFDSDFGSSSDEE